MQLAAPTDENNTKWLLHAFTVAIRAMGETHLLRPGGRNALHMVTDARIAKRTIILRKYAAAKKRRNPSQENQRAQMGARGLCSMGYAASTSQ